MSNLALPRFRIQDASGNAVVGGKLYFYEPGTTTDKDTYLDSDLTSTNTNPVVSGSDGWTGSIYLAAEPYKIVAEDAAGSTLWTIDNHDPSVSTGLSELVIESASANPTVSAENTSSGPAVKAVNSGSGHGVWAEADTSTPVKAALHVVAQDEFPSSPAVGDIVVSSVTKRASLYDGAAEIVVPARTKQSSSSFSGAITGAGTLMDSRSLAANSLSDDSTIRVRVGGALTAASGSPTATVAIHFGFGSGAVVATCSMSSATGSETFDLDAVISVTQGGASALFVSTGKGAKSGASHTITSVSGASGSFDTTAENTISIYGSTTGGTSASAKITIFDVEIA